MTTPVTRGAAGARLRQQRWAIPRAAAPSTFLPLDRRLCGIYTLEFADGERYVGQTVNLLSRLGHHQRTWGDIVAVGFVECAQPELDALERRMITDTERTHVVRNKMFAKMPGGEAALDLVVDSEDQHAWLNGVAPTYPADERMQAAQRRQRTRRQADMLAAHPRYGEILADLTAYIELVIPWPSVTGGLYWGVTAMPSTSRSKERRRLFTLNAPRVELLYMLEFPQQGQIVSSINLAPGHLSRRDHRNWWVRTHDSYRSYGITDSIELELGQMRELLSSPTVLTGARQMALGLMRRGRSSFAKFHSDDLLDAVLIEMSGSTGA